MKKQTNIPIYLFIFLMLNSTLQVMAMQKGKASTHGEKLIWAIRGGGIDSIQWHIQHGADVNYAHEHGLTPLMWAAKLNRISAIQLLLQSGASIDKPDNHKETALMHAVRQNHNSCIDLLLKSGANLDLKNKEGRTALMIAVSHGHEVAAYNLIKCGINLFTQNNDGRTVSEMECLRPGFSVPMYCLARLIRDSIEKSQALFVAIEHNDCTTAKQILEDAPVANTPNRAGTTPLQYALEQMNTSMMLLLLKYGANCSLKDQKGLTVHDYASLYEQEDAHELFLIYTLDTLKHRCIRAIIEADPDTSARIFGKKPTTAQLNSLPRCIEIDLQNEHSETVENLDPFGFWYSFKDDKATK